MGVSKTAPMKWMLKDGTGHGKVFAGPGGWYREHPNGLVELIQCIHGAVESPIIAAGIQTVLNPQETTFALGSNVDFKVSWDEPVNISTTGGTPSINFKIGHVASLTATEVGGAITEINIVSGGSGYVTGSSVTITGTGGTLAAAHVSSVDVNGVITGITITVPGSGYPSNTTATVADPSVSKVAALIGGSKTGATRSTFRFVADSSLGAINTVSTSVSLNSGTIKTAEDGTTNAVLSFPSQYTQPVSTFVS